MASPSESGVQHASVRRWVLNCRLPWQSGRRCAPAPYRRRSESARAQQGAQRMGLAVGYREEWCRSHDQCVDLLNLSLDETQESVTQHGPVVPQPPGTEQHSTLCPGRSDRRDGSLPPSADPEAGRIAQVGSHGRRRPDLIARLVIRIRRTQRRRRCYNLLPG